MGLKLHGSAQSTCSQRVLYVAGELGLHVELVTVDLLKGQHKSPEFLKLQPFGQIPVLEDDGFFLYESRAIALYLVGKAGAKGEALYPKDPKKRALVDQFISVEFSNFNPPVSALVKEAMFKPMFGGGPPDSSVVSEQKSKLGAVLDVYEGILKGKTYLTGEFSLADIFHAPYGNYAVHSGNGDIFEDSKRPNVNKWWKAVATRPAFTALQPKK